MNSVIPPPAIIAPNNAKIKLKIFRRLVANIEMVGTFIRGNANYFGGIRSPVNYS